ncbi:hypothetical protein [Leifsonia soli]|uniref:DUF5709 domain-containing protein n=1 Tax=Leifsonia soli TaxID=582665 RepID=A0A852SXR0_9MICO|nr:hypothetical protein [Leifsonia soli]NYD73505.1 hypothetical protein [Leifsonia soli]
MDETANTDRSEYPDDAGYPDGQGTLDEGTGAFRGPTGDDAADDSRDDTALEGDEVVEELSEFDGPDERGQ